MAIKPNIARIDQGPPPAAQDGQNALAEVGYDPRKGTLVSQMLNNPALFDRANSIIKMLAHMPSAPKHARGNEGLMLWVVDMHLRTGLHPFQLINGVFDPGGGKLGSTAELCLAVALKTKAMRKPPVWEEVGDWSKVQGKFHEEKSQGKRADGSDKGKYAVANYKPEDEIGLGLRVTIHWGDHDEPITYPEYDPDKLAEGEEPPAYWMRDCYPRFSTQWATDPRQQTKNVAIRKIMRTVRPDLMSGMPVDEDAYTPEHIGPNRAKDVTPKTPEGKLDRFAQQRSANRATGKQAAGGNKTAPKQQMDMPPHDEDGVIHDDEDVIDNRPRIWVNDDNPEHPVEMNRLVDALQKVIWRQKTDDELDQVIEMNMNVIMDALSAADQQLVENAIDAKRKKLKG